LRVERERRGLSMNQLATLAGVDVATVSRLEAGAHEPSLRIIRKLAQALGVSVASFFV